MENLSNYEIYKLAKIEPICYIFSVLDDEDEPVYHYYMIKQDSGKPTIIKLNNTIGILNSIDIQLEPIDKEGPEIDNFIKILATLVPLVPSRIPYNLTDKNPNLVKRPITQ